MFIFTQMQQVTDHKVLLYMKGTPKMPRCGYSAQVCRILHMQGVDFDGVNILENPNIKEAVKEHT